MTWRIRKYGKGRQVGQRFKVEDRSSLIGGNTIDSFDVQHNYRGQPLSGHVQVKSRVQQGGDWDSRPFTKDELVSKRMHKAGLYVDDELPDSLKKSVGLHELIESYLVQCKGVSPQVAHRRANEEETKVFGSKCDAGTSFAQAIWRGRGKISSRDLERLRYRYPQYFAKGGKVGDMETKLEKLERQIMELYRKIDEKHERREMARSYRGKGVI